MHPQRACPLETLPIRRRCFRSAFPHGDGLLCSIEPVAFDEAWTGRETLPLDDLRVPVISAEALLANKEASDRLQDQADPEALRALLKRPPRR